MDKYVNTKVSEENAVSNFRAEGEFGNSMSERMLYIYKFIKRYNPE